MRKVIPPCPPIPGNHSSDRQTRIYLIRVVTPLFGGGVEAGVPDATFPIRSTSIRGQLQFWWRATWGAACTTPEELFERHKLIWGATDKASPVEVEVRWKEGPPELKPCAKYDRRNDGILQLRWNSPFDIRNSAIPYALFPFQGQTSRDRRSIEKNPASYIENGEFNLRIRAPAEFSLDVETAVWAWVNFGGIGARTRRGCGSLFGQEVDQSGTVIKELAPSSASPDDLQKWFQQGGGGGNDHRREWPSLPTRLLAGADVSTPIEAWNCAVTHLRNFRQGVPTARQQANPAGRSLYPEPDTIRRITGRNSRGHEPDDKAPDGFPRAERLSEKFGGAYAAAAAGVVCCWRR